MLLFKLNKNLTVLSSIKYLPIAGFLFLVLTLSSCFSQKEIIYKGVSNVNYRSDLSNPQITFDLVVNNPNNWGLRLSDLNTKVSVANHFIGVASLEKTIRVGSKKDVAIPIVLNLSMNDIIALLPTGLSLFGKSSSINTDLEGDLILHKFIFQKKYLFKFNQDVNIK